RRANAAAPARGRRARLRRARLRRRLDRQDHRGGRRRPGHLLPLLRLQEGRLRRARPRPQPAGATCDEGGLLAWLEPARGGAARLRRLLPLHPRASRPLPDHPPGGVRLARDAPVPLREARRRLHGGVARGEGAGRGGGDRPRGERLGADGDRRDARHALHPLGGRRGARARAGRARAHRPPRAGAAPVSRVGIAATAAYLPEHWMTATEVAERSGIPQSVTVEKFGLRGKHIAAADEHVSDLSVRAAEALLEETGIDPASLDVVMYYGSTWKDYAVWQAAPWIAHRIGASRAYAVEYDNVSCGTPVALRIARDMLRAEDELQTILVVAACRESYLLDYANERSRFMFNFGDGAVAGLLVKDGARNELLGCHGITDGSFSLQVKVPSGGSVSPNGGYRFLDVADPVQMKDGLDRVSLANFAAAARGALERSGASLGDVGYLCGIHMKPSMHRALVA